MAGGIQSRALLAAVAMAAAPCVRGAPVALVDEPPVGVAAAAPGVFLVDFGRVAFGNVRLMPPPEAAGAVAVHFGEHLANGRIDRAPPGFVRYNHALAELDGGRALVVAPPPDARNTETQSPRHPPAIPTPAQWGVVLPFRWVEIEGWPGGFSPEQIVRQAAFAAAWDDDAAAFESSDAMLNRIWELCRYSIKATTFAGIYVDGDRERIPYEADAYLNQLGHYCTDNDIQMARDTIDHLLEHPTWPTEWGPHMVFMVHAEWMRTGDLPWLAGRYDALKSKLLLDRRGADGLVASNEAQAGRTDIVDWPRGERDGYVFTARNTVVNAFHLRTLMLMGDLARALGKAGEAREFATLFETGSAAFHNAFFDAEEGLYRDGAGTEHRSLHANLFPLAFGLAPPDGRGHIAAWLAGRGMKCSVYAAQYLLEGLFENGFDKEAIDLVTAAGDRSWRHMVESGATITWEAWDRKYKPNLDWNHAWGAAPANLLPRYVLGAQPLEPGWGVARIRPATGGLAFAKGRVPTPRGPVRIEWECQAVFRISIALPDGMAARVELPARAASERVYCDGKPVQAVREGNRWVLGRTIEGSATFEVGP